jgi:hypothetical protein
MTFLSALDSRDRRLLFICLGIVVLLAAITAFFSRNENNDENTMPSTFLTGKHGARAAYDLLQQSGYNLDRWEQPLGILAAQADAQTVVIFAEPVFTSPSDAKAIQQIVSRGARVLITGFMGGELAPESDVHPSLQFQEACKLTPQGFDPLASSGDVFMVPEASWGSDRPRDRVDYNCTGAPAVVEYDLEKGHVVWWAASTPLENASISRANNLNLFLNAVGPRDGHRFYWDESLHGDVRSQWFYARGPALYLLVGGLIAIAFFILFSFSRRSGPLRDAPQPVRATPVEFLEALGSLYAEAGASSTAVELALERFRRRMGDLCGLKGARLSAEELAAALRRRFAHIPADLEKDLADSEAALGDDQLQPKRALQLVQALNRHSEELTAAARAARAES